MDHSTQVYFMHPANPALPHLRQSLPQLQLSTQLLMEVCLSASLIFKRVRKVLWMALKMLQSSLLLQYQTK